MTQKSFLQRLTRGLALVAVLALVGTMLLACGEEEDVNGGNTGSGGGTATEQPSATPTSPPASPTTNPDLIEYPAGDDDVIIKIVHTGGFVTPETLMTRLPIFIMFGNGCYVTQGPMIEIYPQPSLPNLQQVCLSEDGVQEVLAKAEEAGLLDGDAEYRNDMIADATTTVFTITANGQTTTVSAYALEIDDSMGDPNLPAEEREARQKLMSFLEEVSSIEFWIDPSMIVEESHEYEIEGMQVAFLPADSPHAPLLEEGMEAQALDWPLETALAEFGAEYLNFEHSCGVVEGAELETLMTSLRDSNQLTRWISADPTTGEDEEYVLFIRPLFPTEEGCAEPTY